VIAWSRGMAHKDEESKVHAAVRKVYNVAEGEGAPVAA
jgi:hypothetical protein